MARSAGKSEKREGSKEAGLLIRAAEMLDLPGEVVAGLARIEITGGREVLIENHGEYSNTDQTRLISTAVV